MPAGKGVSSPVFKSGMVGPQGPKGDKGDTGSAGPKGDTGLTGATGPQGIQGVKGDTGSQGAQGIQGSTGPAGTSFSVTSPVSTPLSAGEKNGTAFQPRANGPSMVNITGKLSGLMNVAESFDIAISPTAGGTYTTVALFSLMVNAAGVGVSDQDSGSFLVPAGHYVKITATGTILGINTLNTLLANTAMNRIVWNL